MTHILNFKIFHFFWTKKLNLNSVVVVFFVFLVNLFFSVTEFWGIETKNRLRIYKKPSQTILHRTIINYSFIISRKLFVSFCPIVKMLLLVFSSATQNNLLNFFPKTEKKNCNFHFWKTDREKNIVTRTLSPKVSQKRLSRWLQNFLTN